MRRSFVDAHVHFWDTERLPYPWLSTEPSIAAAHRPADLWAEAADWSSAAPAQVVFVQAECDRSRCWDEVLWAEELARSDRRVAAFVAFAPMDRGLETLSMLERLRARPLVRGVRHLLQDDPDAGRRPSFVAGVRAAGARGLSFDLCVRHGQLSSALALVRSCPDTRFVLDHAGKPDIRSARLDPWRAHIEALAACPHVVCKVSGLVTEADPVSWDVEQLRPYVDHVVACFGPDRSLFGSDWPVAKLASSYCRWLATAQALIAHLPEAAQGAFWSETARRTYGLS